MMHMKYAAMLDSVVGTEQRDAKWWIHKYKVSIVNGLIMEDWFTKKQWLEGWYMHKGMVIIGMQGFPISILTLTNRGRWLYEFPGTFSAEIHVYDPPFCFDGSTWIYGNIKHFNGLNSSAMIEWFLSGTCIPFADVQKSVCSAILD